MSGPSGYTTEQFIDKVEWRVKRYLKAQIEEEVPPPRLAEPDRHFRRNYDVDTAAVKEMFDKYDTDGNGQIDLKEFTDFLVKVNLAPTISKQGKTPDV
jgi:hypothetical protein